jgi:outer membrane protein TolC
VRAQEALRLEEAVRQSLQNNERSRKAPLRVDQAEGQLERARSAFLPNLTAAGSGTQRLEADRSGRSTTTQGTVTLTQPLINPSAFPQYSAASHQLDSEKWVAVDERRKLAYDTARTFLQTLTAERVFEAATKRLDRAKANVQNAQARAEAGLASTNDATRATIDLATSLRETTLAQASVARAYLQLSFLMGRRAQPPLAAPDRTTQAAESFDSPSANQVKAALERRPDLRAAMEKTIALQKSASEPLYRLAPTLNLQAQLRVLPNALPTERAHDETATVNLTWSIFDAGQRYADRRSRLAQAEIQALDESLLRRSVANDVEIALVALRAARDALHIANDAVAATQKGLEETEILYRQGLARAIELTDANGRRFDAEVSRASAKLSMEQAYLDLRNALGFGPIDEEDPMRPK